MASRAERNAISGRLGFNWGVILGEERESLYWQVVDR